MSVVQNLGIDPEDIRWQDLSLCQGFDIEGPQGDIFYDRYEQDLETRRATDDMCLSCPVMAQCYRAGIAGEEEGVWGGVYLVDGKVDPIRNAHKTNKDWEAIWQRLQ